MQRGQTCRAATGSDLWSGIGVGLEFPRPSLHSSAKYLQIGDVHLEITIDRVGIVVADLNLQSIGRSKDAPGEMGVIRGDVQILRGRRAVLLVLWNQKPGEGHTAQNRRQWIS